MPTLTHVLQQFYSTVQHPSFKQLFTMVARNKLLAISLLLAVMGCQKDGPDTASPVDDDAKTLVGFSIPENLNKGNIGSTLEGVIINSDIILGVPETADPSHLIAQFDFEGDAVYVGGNRQVSGVTENDFSEPLIYEVVAGEIRHGNCPKNRINSN